MQHHVFSYSNRPQVLIPSHKFVFLAYITNALFLFPFIVSIHLKIELLCWGQSCGPSGFLVSGLRIWRYSFIVIKVKTLGWGTNLLIEQLWSLFFITNFGKLLDDLSKPNLACYLLKQTEFQLSLSPSRGATGFFLTLHVCCVYDRGEPAVGYRWTGRVWEITGWSWRLQENYKNLRSSDYSGWGIDNTCAACP